MENIVENIGVNVPAERDIEIITIEINYLKGKAGEAIIEIGKRLIEAKEQLAHGEWLPWLSEKVQFSESAAQRFMRLAKEWSNPSTLTDLGTSKALQLLALGAVERDEFIAQKHEINGTEKTVEDMTSRELAEAIKAKKAAEDKAAKLENDLAAAEQRIEAARNVKAVEIVPDKEAEDKLRAEIEDLKKKEFEARAEVDSALMKAKVADKKAESAKEDLAAEKKKAADLAATVKGLKADAKAAEDKAKNAEERVREEVRKAREAAIAEAEQKEAEARKRIEALEKQIKAASSEETALFKVYFNSIQEDAEELGKIIAKLKADGRTEEAARFLRAYKAVLTALLNSAEAQEAI